MSNIKSESDNIIWGVRICGYMDRFGQNVNLNIETKLCYFFVRKDPVVFYNLFLKKMN